MEPKDWWQVGIGGASVLIALALGACGAIKANDVEKEQKKASVDAAKFRVAQEGVDRSVKELLEGVREMDRMQNAKLVTWSSQNTALGNPRVIIVRNYSKLHIDRVLISIHNTGEKGAPVAQHLFVGGLDPCKQKTFKFTRDGVKAIHDVNQVSFTYDADGYHWLKDSGKSLESINYVPVRAGQSIWEQEGDDLVWVDDSESNLPNC
ncbi:hypothetical protein [Streptomyces canus]|uniref:hypothetical protein n=1 Tax=Streptomyces canus TaxID=58343 RepID=UPI002E252948